MFKYFGQWLHNNGPLCIADVFLATNNACLESIALMRWGGSGSGHGEICPRCGVAGSSLRDDGIRKCGACHRKYDVLTGTPLQFLRHSAQTILAAAVLSSARVAPKQITRILKISKPTAQTLVARLAGTPWLMYSVGNRVPPPPVGRKQRFAHIAIAATKNSRERSQMS